MNLTPYQAIKKGVSFKKWKKKNKNKLFGKKYWNAVKACIDLES